MNTLTYWNQLRGNQLNQLEDLQHSPASLFSRSRAHRPDARERVAQWLPLVDISEDAEGYLIKAELPQVKPEDVKVTVEEGTLTITGDREFDQNSKKHHRGERAHGSFVHRFSLPNDVSRGEATAEFKDGVLTVHLAKNEKGKPGEVEAEAAAYDRISNQHDCSSGWGINE